MARRRAANVVAGARHADPSAARRFAGEPGHARWCSGRPMPSIARAAAIAGHAAAEVDDFEALADGRPCHRRQSQQSGWPRRRRARACLRLPKNCARKGGLLVVDEAFMDVGPRAESLAGDVGQGGIVVLRSFGKFFGLAGRAARLCAGRRADASNASQAQLGPWAVAGPALEYGIRALADAELAERDAAPADRGQPRGSMRCLRPLRHHGRRRHDALPLSSTAGRRRPVCGARRTRDTCCAISPIGRMSCASACRVRTRNGSGSNRALADWAWQRNDRAKGDNRDDLCLFAVKSRARRSRRPAPSGCFRCWRRHRNDAPGRRSPAENHLLSHHARHCRGAGRHDPARRRARAQRCSISRAAGIARGRW